jgi:branched-chain amino acid transport system permease protein
MGINLTIYKLLAFAISSFYTGFKGLYALLLGYLEPNMFTFLERSAFLWRSSSAGYLVEGSI